MSDERTITLPIRAVAHLVTLAQLIEDRTKEENDAIDITIERLV